jgi:para-aminobenzoate synthetase component I
MATALWPVEGTQPEDARRRLLHWAAAHDYCAFYDSCATDIDRYGDYAYLLGVSILPNPATCTDRSTLQTQLALDPLAWWMGAFSYDYKNVLEPRLHSTHASVVAVPALWFFRADVVIACRRGSARVEVLLGDAALLRPMIEAASPPATATSDMAGFILAQGFESQFSEADYLAAVGAVRKHIHEGDTYELNLSQNYLAQGRIASPATLWERLIAWSPAPFAGFARWRDTYLLCASPERFLRLQDGELVTQPIKGTAPRQADPVADAAAALQLRSSIKERAENVMIVDLSRNDLHRVCETGSVQVPHLFEVQAFPQVHHLVSTVTGRKRADVSPLAALEAAFPPGSMTGAPKVRTCELIDELERSSRGLYAGALGYFAPNQNFDFNVVIRSLVYDGANGRLSYHVGGAITWDSDPAAEYAETLVKARSLAGILG